MKLCKICTPNGNTWKLKFYSGNLTSELEYNQSESVVLELAIPFLQCGAIIYADIYYSSSPLLEKTFEEEKLLL